MNLGVFDPVSQLLLGTADESVSKAWELGEAGNMHAVARIRRHATCNLDLEIELELEMTAAFHYGAAASAIHCMKHSMW